MRSYKTEINPTPEQIQIIKQTIGVSRFVYNFFLAHNLKVYKNEKRFVSGIEFSKWLNNEFIPNNPEYSWIKEVYAKATKQAIMNAETAFKKFFKGLSKFPRFKKKKNQDVKMYFVKNDAKVVIPCERHRIKIPTLGWIQLKEFGYIPQDVIIMSGTISQKAGRYYISVLVDEKFQDIVLANTNDGIGIDLGIKDFVVISNVEKPVKNINKTVKVKKLGKSLKRQQRKLSRKYESLKKQNKKKGEATRQNIQKQVLKVQKLHQRISNIRENHINQTVNTIVKQKPSFVTIEDLNVRGMMKNRHLSKAIAQQGFNQFRVKLTSKCNISRIELRIVDRFYPTSKTCSYCGYIKKDLKLSDRVYICECGNEMDRDKNAAVNLKNAKTYKIA